MGAGISSWKDVSSCSLGGRHLPEGDVIASKEKSIWSSSISRSEQECQNANEGRACRTCSVDIQQREGRVQANPEVLTPRGPYQEPYALADGPDCLTQPIHMSLEPHSPGEYEFDGRFFPAASPRYFAYESGFESEPRSMTEFPLEGDDSSSLATDCGEYACTHSAMHGQQWRDMLHSFLESAESGLRCEVRLEDMTVTYSAMLECRLSIGILRIAASPSSAHEVKAIRIPGICGICLGSNDVLPSGSLHFDTCDGAFDLFLEGVDHADAYDDFLDCIAILVATLRHRAWRCGEPPPVDSCSGHVREELRSAWDTGDACADKGWDMLRPHGKSLDAEHLAGHAGALLAAFGETFLRELNYADLHQ